MKFGTVAKFIPKSKITSFAPGSGPPGTVVTVMDTRFTGATAVLLNGDSDTSITFTVPEAGYSGAISVTTPDGAAASFLNFSVRPGGKALTTKLTVELWVCPEQDQGAPSIMDLVSRYYSWIFWIQPYQLAEGRAGLAGFFSYGGADGLWMPNPDGGFRHIPDRQWSHLAATLDTSLPSGHLLLQRAAAGQLRPADARAGA
ncbi:IPT/TIG domain-containing protein [Hymenobacter sp. CRA2]|uniref:IPT/TIG domain-containing protein n=1 Tax=Hymenobacter sp. CRA2 TaxID=1955620 RepID=UPI00098ED9EB|nr:IPT/TIG domain-containing protein [Hymenobacter sp. CRA2]OON67639.1 hypothetical protein B0919_17600 [Hymenobacter sp. CRA2]